ncbi:hypothetical protein F5Y15DRAFT_171847 [Xylariaceae sp. FL0016]|nr:hypothetical protein F5Y15DRAFT_171847 [Xylariaceae sp. FL0016]
MAGFLIPPWYHSEEPSQRDFDVCSIIWGFTICCAVFSGAKASRQTWKSFRRGRLPNTYITIVWAEWIASMIISVISWMYLGGFLGPGFWLFFVILCLWTVQVQCILQIIINRVALIMTCQTSARRLRWGVFAIVLAINVSVFCIWIPARLQISPRYVRVNEIWDRMEKVIFAVVDASLNIYFIYLVRTKLISAGLKKYDTLFRFNIGIIFISMSLDILLIGVMSIGTGVVYIQFHPMVYLIKLHIELNMAELIGKIVKASNPLNDRVIAHVPTAATALSSSMTTTTMTSKARARHFSDIDLDVELGDLGTQYLGAPGITKSAEAESGAQEQWTKWNMGNVLQTPHPPNSCGHMDGPS